MRAVFSSLLLLVSFLSACQAHSKCRNVPGSASFPNATAWSAFNATVSGRLAPVVPSAKYCANLPCTDAQWSSGLFRSTIPGAMDQINFEQGYDLNPPSLCLRNSTACGQGDVPIYSVEAETVQDVQAAVRFAGANHLRLVVKSSGHDHLGRSTAPNSLLIHMAKFKDVVFTDAFIVGGQNMGSAVTLGAGVHAKDMHYQTGVHGKVAVGPPVATLCPAGGYFQGAGHSSISPLLGLGADNVLEIQIVIASGALLKVNNISNPDLFWALRGGGAGSWGVIISVTVRTFPTFNATISTITLDLSTNAAAAAVAGVHAQHIFDFDSVRGGQYFFLQKAGNSTTFLFQTFMANATLAQGKGTAHAVPHRRARTARRFPALPGFRYHEHQRRSLPSGRRRSQQCSDGVALDFNGGVSKPQRIYDSSKGISRAFGWRSARNPGKSRRRSLLQITGQVSANANISSAVHPAWRTAKTHLIVVNIWEDTAALADINRLRHEFQNSQLTFLEQLSGPNAGSYSSEGDIFEPDFMTTFYGPNYAKLSAIKNKYDPFDLFIVAVGVGSERWDEWGICTV
ncbi:FAD-binding domain-containing protein [Mycena venus]|uniref:FAD-binding domain-containing protein n=1 Tax=Mycena venus TaxID=2733690 RepID=A0A8H6YP36_9AGAR|nr:FAD-binding domain-containing protein [Mycena venus]